MKKYLLLGFLLIYSLYGYSQNLKVLENKIMRVSVGFGGLDEVESDLGFNEESLEAEIKQIFRSNGLRVSNDPYSNLHVIFIIEALVDDDGTIVFSSDVTVSVTSAFTMIQDSSIPSEWLEKDEFQLEYFHIYRKAYLGSAGSLRYNSLKESLLSLARELVEEYFDDIE